MANVIKSDYSAEIHKDGIVRVNVGFNTGWQALELAHGFIRKVAHRTGVEGRADHLRTNHDLLVSSYFGEHAEPVTERQQ